MDFSSPATHTLEDISDKKRLDSFRMGAPAPSTSHHARKFSHSRSHSRNASVSPLTLSLPSVAALSHPSPSSPPASPPSHSAPGNPKRNSHHRRRSSVSTRRESAEIMGVSMLNATSPSIEENINLGDKDSIRRRALLTLEGKTDVGAFSRVEIPELETPDLERRFDFPTKPSFPPGMGAGFGGSLSSLGGSKRDSLGKFRASVSSKEQLGTLVEEDEEAEDVGYERSPVSPNLDGFRMEQVSSPTEMAAVEEPPAPARHRPTTLNLRPLSLASNHRQPSDLPTPEPSPNPRPRSGLRALTLSPSLSIETVQPPVDTENVQKRRQSMFVSSSTSSSFEPARRPSLSSAIKENAPPVPRRTSISYVSSSDSSSFPISGLPTPEMTPTSDRRYSISSESSSSSSLGSRGSRSLSTSEHHFLYQAHTALVQRISDLERALSARPRFHHQSYASEASNPIEPPTDEMLQLITDLKSERDELKKDVEGWRTRVSDCSGQVTLLMKRVEVERREAWVARERAGLIEIEKKSLEKALSDKETWGEQGWRKYETTQSELAKALDECQQLRQKTTRYEELQSECTKLAAALMEERKKREEVERELDSLLTTPTPQAVDSKYHTPPVSRTMIFAKRSGLGFRSIDSTGSFTDVESLSDPSERPQYSLKSVEEEEEYEEYSQEYSQELSQSDSNDVDGLAGYEDEDENDDYSFHDSLSSSSFGSQDFPRETSHLLELSVESEVPELTSSRSVSPSPAPESPPQSHRRRVSLSKAWTFPRSTDSAIVMPPREAEEIDRFFGCLEDVDNSPPIDSKLRSAESSKNLFSQALADADDDLPPFLIPTTVGVEVPASESRTGLDVVIEEDEADDEDESDSTDIDDDVSEIVGEVVDGGIIFTFTPPADFGIPEDVPLPQPAPEAQRQESERVFSKPSLSSIPRPASKVFVSSIPTASTTPPRTTSAVAFPKPTGSPATFSTPIKAMDSSSPQASSTPKRTQGSFIPQPRRSNPMSNTSSRPMYSTPTKGQSKPRSSILDIPEVHSTQGSPLLKDEMNIHAHSDLQPIVHDAPASPAVSPTLAALQTLTSFIPMPSFPWSSPKLNFGTPSVASCFMPSSSGDDGFSPRPSTPPATPTEPPGRTYVSRQSQLAKLRLRLHQEHLQRQAQPRHFVARNYQDGVLDI